MNSVRGRQLLPRQAAPAFTLVESIIAAAIVAVMLVASINLLGAAAGTRAAGNDRRTGLMLAHQLMAEIQQQPYKDESIAALLFGPELGETGTTPAGFDDVDDYNKFDEKPPRLKDGTALAGYSAWRRTVTVTWVDPVTMATSLVDTGLKLVEVKATDPRGRAWSVSALRSLQTGPQAPPAGTTALMWTGIELEAAGKTPRAVTAGVEVVTHPAAP